MTDQTEADEQVLRDFAKALFADPDEPDEPDPDEQQKPSGHVPGEGTNPATHADLEDMREFTRNLFFPDPDA